MWEDSTSFLKSVLLQVAPPSSISFGGLLTINTYQPGSSKDYLGGCAYIILGSQDKLANQVSLGCFLGLVKNLPAMQEMQVRCLGQEDPQEEGIATHSSILPWRSPWAEEPGGL